MIWTLISYIGVVCSIRETTLWELQLSTTKDVNPSVTLTNAQKLNENESTQHNVPRHDAHIVEDKVARGWILSGAQRLHS